MDSVSKSALLLVRCCSYEQMRHHKASADEVELIWANQFLKCSPSREDPTQTLSQPHRRYGSLL